MRILLDTSECHILPDLSCKGIVKHAGRSEKEPATFEREITHLVWRSKNKIFPLAALCKWEGAVSLSSFACPLSRQRPLSVRSGDYLAVCPVQRLHTATRTVER